MKCSTLALSTVLLSSNAAASSSSSEVFNPHRIDYEDLLHDRFSLLDALEDSSGIVSMTNLPEDFASIKKDVMTHLHSCLLEQEDEDGTFAEESFPDGTVRRTFATATTVEEGPLPLKLNNSNACRSFEKNLERFRSIADKATNRFASALSREMEPNLSKPLLNKKNNPVSFYDTIEDLVANGEVLEHFHSYQKIGKNSDKTWLGEVYDEKKKMNTIDLHADQGFFIAFTPGLMISPNDENAAVSSSEGFYIVEEGSDSRNNPIHVDFNVDTDDLVFMLGDGVNQYINNRLNGSDRRRLRATPHAVSLKYHDESLARVWYGRMVLPPNDALVTTTETQTTLTYGDVRRRLVETPDEYIPAGLGCSSPTMRALQHNNEESSACAKGSLLCWARCMELSEYDITEEMCEEQNLGLKCINPRGQFTTGESHGDYWPACTNTTTESAPYPEIPQKDEEVCSSDAWETFMAAGTDGVTYDHSFDLTNEKNSGAAFQWSVVDEDKGIVRGRIVFGDIFGWLSTGFANPLGKHNGMNDGNILMALPGGNYTALYGLTVPGLTNNDSDEISVALAKKRSSAIVTESNPEGSTVYEYHIDPDGSSFRHWSEPVGTGNDNANVIVNDCFTAMTFETDNIDGKYFNVSGIDEMMWAGNSKDYHVGYHGRGNRARFSINWETGEGTFWTEEEELIEIDHGGDEHDHEDSGADETHRMGSFSILAATATTLLALNGIASL